QTERGEWFGERREGEQQEHRLEREKGRRPERMRLSQTRRAPDGKPAGQRAHRGGGQLHRTVAELRGDCVEQHEERARPETEDLLRMLERRARTQEPPDVVIGERSRGEPAEDGEREQQGAADEERKARPVGVGWPRRSL